MVHGNAAGRDRVRRTPLAGESREPRSLQAVSAQVGSDIAAATAENWSGHQLETAVDAVRAVAEECLRANDWFLWASGGRTRAGRAAATACANAWQPIAVSSPRTTGGSRTESLGYQVMRPRLIRTGQESPRRNRVRELQPSFAMRGSSRMGRSRRGRVNGGWRFGGGVQYPQNRVNDA